jgi:hypothetical protein
MSQAADIDDSSQDECNMPILPQKRREGGWPLPDGPEEGVGEHIHGLRCVDANTFSA